MSRIVILSNRLPLTVSFEAGEARVEPSTGGLATGMRGPHERLGGLWIGWPGFTDELPPEHDEAVQARFDALRVVSVALTREEVETYYEGYCNGVLWPLFHGLLNLMPLEIEGFDVYQRINQRFADAAAAHYEDGDQIWVHDYQLMLVPAMLRKRLPRARIGFFLHIPFPSPEIFRTLPQRDALLEGVLGADLIGLHTAEYARRLSSSVMHVHGRPTEMGRVRWGHRAVRIGAFPMGVDAPHFDALARDPEVHRLAEAFRSGFHGKLLLGIDRLDYTKGIPRRLLAYERLLRDNPELRGQVRLVQVAVPSRENIGAYQDLRHQVDALTGRINGQFGSPSWVPVHYLTQGMSEAEVVALYLSADVMLVTPLKDGMNLVAKEFVASRVDEQGVLLLSEFTGASQELAEAVQVNPYDVDRTAQAYRRALSMPGPPMR